MGTIGCQLLGRFGNQCMGYLFARGYAEAHGHTFKCEPWIGDRLFELNDLKWDSNNPEDTRLVMKSDVDMPDGEGDIRFRCYAQTQRAITYTRAQARKWLKIRPEIEKILQGALSPRKTVVAHLRRGDYYGYGYPVVSTCSYYRACERFSLDLPWFVSEENPLLCGDLPNDMAFLPDFYQFMRAPVLLRANSTFSWVAALLGSCDVYSPVVSNLVGGQEHDCNFVRGNWPAFTNLAFVEDLHVKEQ